jgi:hypothetical protein
MNYTSFSNSENHDINRLRNILTNLKQGSSDTTNVEYLKCVQNVYGAKKVQDVCSRYCLFHQRTETKPLRIEDVKKLQQGLNDIRSGDLDKFIKKLRRSEPFSGKNANSCSLSRLTGNSRRPVFGVFWPMCDFL